jgi:hypothetical protein
MKMDESTPTPQESLASINATLIEIKECLDEIVDSLTWCERREEKMSVLDALQLIAEVIERR